MSDFYIYNFVQCKFMLDAGLKVVEIGVGNKGDVYHRFERNEESERVLREWQKNSPRFEKDLNNGEDRPNHSRV